MQSWKVDQDILFNFLPVAEADQMHLNCLTGVGAACFRIQVGTFTPPSPETPPYTLILSCSCPCTHKSFSCTVPMKYPSLDSCPWVSLFWKIKPVCNSDIIWILRAQNLLAEFDMLGLGQRLQHTLFYTSIIYPSPSSAKAHWVTTAEDFLLPSFSWPEKCTQFQSALVHHCAESALGVPGFDILISWCWRYFAAFL